ncbi:MAG: hypothetical protein NTY63_00770 [Candidatus Bipolaricaulota bacterium]|nr:hypothetical protein [Candidatus Bipolaricaulota bacterium]
MESSGLVAQEKDVPILVEVQLLMSEKRTALSIMRTGIAILALPLSVLSVLIATSRYYDVGRIVHLYVAVLVLCGILVGLSVWLIVRAILRIRDLDRVIRRVRAKFPNLADVIR